MSRSDQVDEGSCRSDLKDNTTILQSLEPKLRRLRDGCSSSTNVQPNGRTNRRVDVWWCPKEGAVKINVDAGCRNNLCTYALFVRDASGDFLEASSRQVLFSTSMEVEAFSILKALQLSALRAFEKLIVESDALLVTAIHLSHEWPWKLISLLAECCCLWCKSLDCVTIQYTPRTSNMVAHVLAQQAFLVDESSAFSSPPTFISTMLA